MHHPRHKGFSFIEVIVAIAIIVILAVSTGTMMSRFPINSREVRNQALALRIAQNEIEALRSLGYDNLPATGPFTSPLLTSFASSTASATITDYNAKTKQADITVLWEGEDLATRSLTLTTLITQNSGL